MKASKILELLEESVSSFSESDDDSVADKTYKPPNNEEVSQDENEDDDSNHEQADPVADREDLVLDLLVAESELEILKCGNEMLECTERKGA